MFASPRSLNVWLDYSGRGPMSEMPEAWPVLPVILVSSLVGRPMSDQLWDNMVSALESEYCNRIREIHLSPIPISRWERFVAAMQKPFPELTSLEVSVYYWDRDWVPVLPDSFLGGFAPRLQELRLGSIPFPSIPKLLLSANGLIALTVSEIPDSGYFSPDAMAAALTAMTPFVLTSFPLDLAPTQKADLCLRPHALSSLLSPNSCSKVFMSIWRSFWPESVPLFSPTLTSDFSRTSTLTSHNFT